MLLTVREIVKAIVPDVGHISRMIAFSSESFDADTQVHEAACGTHLTLHFCCCVIVDHSVDYCTLI